MFDKLFNSIVFRIGSMMFLISFVSIISMFSSVFISEMAEHDALIINDAGSLRKQSYKIFAELELLPQIKTFSIEHYQDRLNQSIDSFTAKIDSPLMHTQVDLFTNNALLLSLGEIKESWHREIKPRVVHLANNPEKLNEDTLLELQNIIENFVLRIDNMVTLYQQRAESRILMIRMILGISLFITTLLAAVTMVQISRRIEKPLSELTGTAKKIMTGDYTARTSIKQDDELGLLAETMNKMSEALSVSYGELEQRVENKTAALRRSKESLELLYQTSQLINQSDNVLDLSSVVNRLSEITNKTDIDLCLTTEQSSIPYEHIITADKDLPERCNEGDCGSCLKGNDPNDFKKIETMSMRYPIKKDDISYGVLVCNLHTDKPLQAWQHQLFTSIATLIANGLHVRQQNEQGRRITLLNERNVIARELHDSLAQALSYLKIQVTRLQKLRAKNASEEQIEDVIEELKTGLSAAYRQLRELLTTFRLQIDVEGLQQTFMQMITQLRERAPGIDFQLDYRIDSLPLTPNEEIHLMQIAREATQNATNHSHGSKIKVSVFTDQQQNVHLCITDNGRGLPEDPAKLNHYGLAIMQERSQHLNGDISIKNGDENGTEVELIFRPNYLRDSLSA